MIRRRYFAQPIYRALTPGGAGLLVLLPRVLEKSRQPARPPALPAVAWAYPPQLKFELILSKLTVTTPAALVLRWAVSCTTKCKPSVPARWKVLVKCWTSFFSLNDSPNQAAKWPLAETPRGSSGVKVTVPSSVPVTQNSSLTVKNVTWKTSFAAIAVSVPGSPVQGFVTGSENSVTSWACSVIVTVP